MKLSRNLFIILLIVANIAVDQITKIIVRANMAVDSIQDSINVIGNYFILIRKENTGAFLGLGSDLSGTTKLIFLLIVPALILGYLIYYIINTKDMDRLSLIGLCCIAGGGIANVFDRFALGSVTDFIYIEITDVLKTGVLNFADISVTSGMALLLISFIKHRKKKDVKAS